MAYFKTNGCIIFSDNIENSSESNEQPFKYFKGTKSEGNLNFSGLVLLKSVAFLSSLKKLKLSSRL